MTFYSRQIRLPIEHEAKNKIQKLNGDKFTKFDFAPRDKSIDFYNFLQHKKIQSVNK